MIPSWLLPDTITVQHPVGTGQTFADPDYTDAPLVEMKARIVHRTRRALDAHGIETVSTVEIATQEELQQHTRIWLPGTDTGTESESRVPMRVNKANGFGVGDLWVTYLG